MARSPRTLAGIIGRIKRGEKVQASVMRKVLRRNKLIQTILKIPPVYDTKLQTLFNEAEERLQKGESPFARITDEESGASFQLRTMLSLKATKSEKKKEKQKFLSLERQGQIYRKLFPKLMEDKDVGHENISVVTSILATAMTEIGKDDPVYKYIRALYATALEIDKVTNKNNLNGQNLDVFMESIQEVLSSPIDLAAEANITVDTIKGTKGILTGTTENRALNRLKGQPAKLVLKLFNELLEGQLDELEKVYSELNILDVTGSGSITDDVLDLTHEGVEPKLKQRKRAKKNESNATLSQSKAKSFKLTRQKTRFPNLTVKNKKSKNKNAKLQKSMFTVMAMINQKLPNTVRKNMKVPRLESQTGRFAESVKLTDVQTTRQGFPSFGYTYQRDPYQVFENTGGKAPWSNGQRDPRQLIDASIREIAANLALGRFYTRRV